MQAWLVTWDWGGDAQARADLVAAIYPAEWDLEKVAEHVEWLFALHTSTAGELATYARNPSDNPYRAKVDGLIIHCGYHPWLRARVVADLHITRDADWIETLQWKEPNLSTPGTFREEPEADQATDHGVPERDADMGQRGRAVQGRVGPR